MTTTSVKKYDSDVPDGSEYLSSLGSNVRAARARAGMTRKMLASQSGVSERYLAQLETGQGNVSVLVLRQIATAMSIEIVDLLAQDISKNFEAKRLFQEISSLSLAQLEEMRQILQSKFTPLKSVNKGSRIALVGLRGAGKSTLGALLAVKLGCKFIELNNMVEEAYGAGLGEIFSLSGQATFRRLERQCLQNLIDDGEDYVIATGGSIVADEETYALLLQETKTIWVQTSPEEHMNRVVRQGDMRPMAGNKQAMNDLVQILKSRTSLYQKAISTINTSNRAECESLEDLCTVMNNMN